jgi:site-specific DNA recombinase
MREKWKVVGAYLDAAISGVSVILRPGIQSLLQDACAANSRACWPRLWTA